MYILGYYNYFKTKDNTVILINSSVAVSDNISNFYTRLEKHYAEQPNIYQRLPVVDCTTGENFKPYEKDLIAHYRINFIEVV